MNRRIPVDHRVAIRRERLAERDGRIELPPVLIEVDYSQSIGPLTPGQSTTVMMVLRRTGINSSDQFYNATLTAATSGDSKLSCAMTWHQWQAA